MRTLVNNNTLTIVNLSIVAYFGLLYLLDFLKIDFVLLGVVREIFTIPFLLAQMLFLVLGIIHVVKHKTHFLTIMSIILLAINAIYTIGSFL
jgi:hypothetical protein